MPGLKNRGASQKTLRIPLMPALVAGLFVLFTTGAAMVAGRFERTYTPQGAAHLTISNMNGDITVTAWDKKTLSVRAKSAPGVTIEDQVAGDEITVSVKKNLQIGHADFEVYAPQNTSLSLKNVLGKIEVEGINGHVSVNSIDSDIRLIDMRAASIEVKVTSGDILFEGDLYESGSYSLQSVKGDIDVTLPASTSFNLVTRAMSENINLGGFLSSLRSISKGEKGLSGTYLKGGARLSLITYDGRILLHQK